MKKHEIIIALTEDEHNPLAIHDVVAQMARVFDRNCPLKSYRVERYDSMVEASFIGLFTNSHEVFSKADEMIEAAHVQSGAADVTFVEAFPHEV